MRRSGWSRARDNIIGSLAFGVTASRHTERSAGKASKGSHDFIAISCTPRGQPPEVDQRVHSDGREIAQEAGPGLRFRTRGRAGEDRPLDEIGHRPGEIALLLA